MKAKVISAFRDLADGERLRLPGEEYEADEARVSELAAKGLVEPPRKPAPRRKAQPKG
ncbi:MAG: hypothetical protein IJ087_14775 [Eggerthellaceae bacterium]|nr:hypothetical protein [Eggerthellaceae bacterium]